MKPTPLLIAVALIATPVAAQDGARRAATIESLQKAGTALGTLPACALAGYETDAEQIEAHVSRAVADAQAAGMFEEIASSYVQAGQKGQGSQLFDRLTSLRHMAETNDRAYPQAARAFATEVVAACDALASDPEAAQLFTYKPANKAVARDNMLRRLGEPATKRR